MCRSVPPDGAKVTRPCAGWGVSSMILLLPSRSLMQGRQRSQMRSADLTSCCGAFSCSCWTAVILQVTCSPLRIDNTPAIFRRLQNDRHWWAVFSRLPELFGLCTPRYLKHLGLLWICKHFLCFLVVCQEKFMRNK